MSKIYLAIPYTYNPALSHGIANAVSAELMSSGHIVFSPISHSHMLADYMEPELRFSHDFWMKQDLPFIEWCDEVRVVSIGTYGKYLIETSKCCQMEIDAATKLNKPVKYIEYGQ